MGQENSQDYTSISLADLVGVLFRRKVLILLCACLCVAMAIFYIKTEAKLFEAKAVLMLEQQKKNLQIESIVSGVDLDFSFVVSEIQVLSSRSLMESVLDKLELFSSPSSIYHPENKAKAFLNSVLLRKEKTPFKSTTISEAEKKKNNRNMLIDYALKNLTVEQIEKSRAIEITYFSHIPEIAEQITNMVAQSYIDRQISQGGQTVSQANIWLKDRVEILQKNVAEAEQKIVDYQKTAGIIDSRGIDLIEQDISQLSNALIVAKGELAKAQSNYDEIKNVKSADSIPSVLASNLIQRLRERQAQSMDELRTLKNQYGPNHPEMVSAQSRVNEIQSEISKEIWRIRKSIESAHKIAQRNVTEIETQLESLKEKYNVYKASSIEMQALEREAKANRELLETLNLRWKEVQTQEDMALEEPYAKIISEATTPTRPKSPKPKIILAVALIGGLSLGIALAIAIDFLQTGVYNGKQLQDITGLPNITRLRKLNMRGESSIGKVIEYPKEKQLSAYMESIRDISSSVKHYLEKDTKKKFFNFISLSDNDEKLHMLTCLAQQIALEGIKICLIDFNMRDSTLTSALGDTEEPGLSDLIEEKVNLDQLPKTREDYSFEFISRGRSNDLNVIRQAGKWENLYKDLDAQYDIILINPPHSEFISDIEILSKYSLNILCVRYIKTPSKLIYFTLNTLKQMGFEVMATIITTSKTARKAI
ncbi:MAG: exopolysaccharide transport family protein [Alphaproteobacteria bacterium]|nr:exopolysaccharide transport family protein [Alphaproteobacteria bacterium]